MRSFTCYDCGHQFQLAHGVGGSGSQLACPNCGGRNIHRAAGDRGFARSGRGSSRLGRGRGGLGRGPSWTW